MNLKRRITKWIAVILLGIVLLQTAACGTILYPERKGQRTGRMDPAVVVLDGIGCLFFIIPGLVAFIVDFATGAIYLPPGQNSVLDSSIKKTDALPVAEIDPDVLDLNTLELMLAAKTGKVIDLHSPNLKICQISDAKDFGIR